MTSLYKPKIANGITWRPRGLSKEIRSRVIVRVTPFRVPITLLITYLLSPLDLQVLGLLDPQGAGFLKAESDLLSTSACPLQHSHIPNPFPENGKSLNP